MTLHGSIISRRAFLANAVAIAATAARSNAAQKGTRLVLLGTGGGPRPRKASSASAQVIVADDVAYVVDCGDGVARQLAFADVPLNTLRHVFITHQHSDHTADYGNLIWLAWTAGLRTRVDTWGPPPLERMTQLFLEMNGRALAATDPGDEPSRIDAWGRLEELTMPVLVLVGTLDLPDFQEHAQLLAQRVAHGQLVVLEGVAHLPHLESDAACLDAIAEFLHRLDEAG